MVVDGKNARLLSSPALLNLMGEIPDAD
jgi:hypothetical protein